VKPSTAKSKGRETENKFVEWINRNYGLKTERRRLMGTLDKGDVSGISGVCVEVKSGAHINIPQWLRELKAEVKNSNADVGFVAVRLRDKPDPEDWCVIMPLPEFAQLLSDGGWIPERIVE